MTKFRKSLLIFGILVLLIGAVLGTFIVLSLTGSLKDEPIALEFTIGNLPREYNGKPQKASKEDKDCWELVTMDGYLVEGHTLDVEFTGEQTDVGYCAIGLDVKVVNQDGYDVTDQYKIKVNKGLLYVYQRAVNIKLTSTKDLIYDGNSIDIGDKYIASGIVNGHRVALKLTDDWYNSSDKIVVGKPIDTRFVEYQILDGNGTDVSDNYVLESLSGSISILPRPITISPVSAEKTYDGKPLTCTDYRIDTGSLAAGHYIAACSFESENGEQGIINAGSINIQLSGAVICDIEGNDVTKNYYVAPGLDGTLTVNRAPLTVTAKSASWVYDGNEHSFADDDKPYSVIGLVNNENVTVKYDGAVSDISTELNRIIECYIDNGGDGNYAITYIDGKIEVTKAPLTVSLKPIDGQYGDDSDKKLEELYEIDSTINNLRIKLTDEDYVSNLLKKAEIGVSIYTLNNFKIVNDSEIDITDKFNITLIPGNLSITRREVELSVTGLEKIYDGNLTFKSGFEIADLVEGHKVESVTVNTENKIESISLLDLQGNSVARYYNVTYPEAVSFTIGKRNLSISTQTLTKVYDGQPLYGGEIILESSLAVGDRIVITEPVSAVDCVTGKSNAPEFEIYNTDNQPVKDKYYNLEDPDYGTLTVTNANLTIVGKSDSFVYDGKPHSSEGPDLVLGLAPGDKVTLTYITSLIAVGIADKNDFDYTITDIGTDADTGADTRANTDKSGNYIVDKVTGTLQITKAPLTVTLKELKKQYGDSFDTDELCTVLSSINNLEVELNEDIDVLLKDVTIGTSTYSITDFNVLSNGNDVTDNFDIAVVSGNVIVTPRDVELSVTNLSKTYDGNLTFKNGFSIPKLVSGHKTDSITVDAEGNVLSVSIIDEQGSSANGYYNIKNISDKFGAPTITARPLAIKTESFEKTYDGTPLYGGDIILESSLAVGDVLVTTEQASIINCEDSKDNNNQPKFKILNSENQEVTTYYDWDNNTNYGKLTVNKKGVNVWLEYCQIEYNETIGNADLQDKIRCDVLSSNKFSVADINAPTVGEQTVTIDWEASVKDDLSKNYNIVAGSNKFEIIHREKADSLTKDNKDYDTVPINQEYIVSVISKQPDYTFVSSNLVGLTEAGEYEAEIIYKSDTDRLTVTGTYKINPLTVKVTANETVTKTYDGKPFDPNDVLNSLVVSSSLTNVTFSVVSCVRSNEIIVVKDVEQTQSFSSVELKVNGTNERVNPSNIKLDTESGISVTVEKRKLSIKTQSFEKIYDGKPLYGGDIILNSSLAFGDVLVTTKQKFITDHKDTEEKNNQPEFDIFDKDGNSVNENCYEIVNTNYGTLTIRKKEVFVWLEYCQIVYNESLQNTDLKDKIRCADLSFENFSIAGVSDTKVGKQTVEIDWVDTVKDTLGGNYEIVSGSLEFEIIHREKAEPLSEDNKDYDTVAIDQQYIRTHISPQTDDYIFVSSNLVGLVDAGTYNAEIIYESDTERLTVTGIYKINPLEVNVYLEENYATEYDDDIISALSSKIMQDCEYLETSDFEILWTFVRVGTQTVAFAWDNSLNRNYDIKVGNVEFEIDYRKTTIEGTVKKSKIYDAIPINESNLAISEIMPDKMGENYQLVSSDLLGEVNAGNYTAQIVYESATDRLTVTCEYAISKRTLTVLLNTIYYPASVPEDDLENYFYDERDLSSSVSVSGLLNNDEIKSIDIKSIYCDVGDQVIEVNLKISLKANDDNYVLIYNKLTAELIRV